MSRINCVVTCPHLSGCHVLLFGPVTVTVAAVQRHKCNFRVMALDFRAAIVHAPEWKIGETCLGIK